MKRQTSKDVLAELLDFSNATVVDVGCGDGWLTRWMSKRGAHVIGVEVSPRQLKTARNIATVADEEYLLGAADDLPVASRSADIVIFFNSFHHVGTDRLPQTLQESARVLKSGGILYIAEPLAEGPYFELMQPVHDETQVRRGALEALHWAPEYGLLIEKQFSHIDTVKLLDFEAFHTRLTSINPHIRERFDEEEELLRERFEVLGRQVEDGWVFDQPMRVCLLRRG